MRESPVASEKTAVDQASRRRAGWVRERAGVYRLARPSTRRG